MMLMAIMLLRHGIQFEQIIVPKNHSMAMIMPYIALAIASVSIILIYAKMNKALRLRLNITLRRVLVFQQQLLFHAIKMNPIFL